MLSGKLHKGEQQRSVSDVDQFRKQAEECRQQAEETINPLDKESWLQLSGEWTKLALGAVKPCPVPGP